MQTLKPAGKFPLDQHVTLQKSASRTDASHDRAAKTTTTFLPRILYLAETVYLFTCDNHDVVVVPWTLVGVVNALSGPALTMQRHADVASILTWAPHALCWMWLNVLVASIANQRLTQSVLEDRINKPWRAIPQGRLTPVQARNLLLMVVIPLDIAYGIWLQDRGMSCFAIILSYMYNDLGGADVNYVIRNLVNALAIVVASVGTTVVSLHGRHLTTIFNNQGYLWIAIQAAIVMTTVQIQDLRDQEGDRERGRSTMPVVLSDELTRWSIAVPLMLWSIFCPLFWQATTATTFCIVALGGYLSRQLLTDRTVVADKRGMKLWGLWTLCIFGLPMTEVVFS